MNEKKNSENSIVNVIIMQVCIFLCLCSILKHHSNVLSIQFPLMKIAMFNKLRHHTKQQYSFVGKISNNMLLLIHVLNDFPDLKRFSVNGKFKYNRNL